MAIFTGIPCGGITRGPRKHPELYGGILTSELIRVKQSLAAPLDGSKSVRDVTDEKWLLLVLEETQLLAADTLVAGIASTCSNKESIRLLA